MNYVSLSTDTLFCLQFVDMTIIKTINRRKNINACGQTSVTLSYKTRALIG